MFTAVNCSKLQSSLQHLLSVLSRHGCLAAPRRHHGNTEVRLVSLLSQLQKKKHSIDLSLHPDGVSVPMNPLKVQSAPQWHRRLLSVGAASWLRRSCWDSSTAPQRAHHPETLHGEMNHTPCSGRQHTHTLTHTYSHIHSHKTQRPQLASLR